MFPLLRAFSRVVVLDDDTQFLAALSLAVPSRFDLSLHSRVKPADREIQESRERLAREQSDLDRIAVDDEHSISSALRYLNDPSRFGIVGVLVIDYAMPAETGLAFCARNAFKGLRRILLTGFAETQMAISAFNEGLIEMFMSKQELRLLDKLHANMDAQMLKSADERGSALAHTIPQRIRALFAGAEVKQSFAKYLDQLGVVEYVFLGRPLGLVAVTGKGEALWIQLEDETTLDGLIEIMTEEGWPNEEIDQVRNRESAADVEIASQLPGHKARCKHLRALSMQPYLGAAAFPLEGLSSDLVPARRTAWLDANARGAIE